MADKSLADIAKEKNVDVQKVIDVLIASEKAHIDELVKDGVLTTEQADRRKAGIEKRVNHMVNNVRSGKPALKHLHDFPSLVDAPELPA